MANPFTNNQASPRAIYEQKYTASRMNLLLVVVFTAINLVLLVTNSDSYFLFSAFIPYYMASMGMLMCGLFPEEFYTGELSGMAFLDPSVFYVLLVIAAVLTLLYVVAWFFSNKHRVGWLIFILVFFCLDTAGMLFITGISLESIIDILFHAWVIYYLVSGIVAHYKLKGLPPEEEPILVYEGDAAIEATKDIATDNNDTADMQ